MPPWCCKLLPCTGLRATVRVNVRWRSKVCFQTVKPKKEDIVKVVNPRKVAIASELKDTFATNNFVAVFHYNDLNAMEWTNLRLKFSENKIKVKVFPSKISSKVLSSTRYNIISPLFCGSTAVAVEEHGGPSTVSKLLSDVHGEGKLILLGGMVDEQLLSPDGLKRYSKLQSMDMLRQELVSILSQSPVNLKQSLEASAFRLSNLLDQVSKGAS